MYVYMAQLRSILQPIMHERQRAALPCRLTFPILEMCLSSQPSLSVKARDKFYSTSQGNNYQQQTPGRQVSTREATEMGMPEFEMILQM